MKTRLLDTLFMLLGLCLLPLIVVYFTGIIFMSPVYWLITGKDIFESKYNIFP